MPRHRITTDRAEMVRLDRLGGTVVNVMDAEGVTPAVFSVPSAVMGAAPSYYNDEIHRETVRAIAYGSAEEHAADHAERNLVEADARARRRAANAKRAERLGPEFVLPEL